VIQNVWFLYLVFLELLFLEKKWQNNVMFLEHTVVVTCLYMAWIRGTDRQLCVTHGNVMRNGVAF